MSWIAKLTLAYTHVAFLYMLMQQLTVYEHNALTDIEFNLGLFIEAFTT